MLSLRLVLGVSQELWEVGVKSCTGSLFRSEILGGSILGYPETVSVASRIWVFAFVAAMVGASEERELERLEKQVEEGGGGVVEYLSLVRKLKARRSNIVAKHGLELLNKASARSKLGSDRMFCKTLFSLRFFLHFFVWVLQLGQFGALTVVCSHGNDTSVGSKQLFKSTLRFF